jgi:hypothetical protein
MLLKNKDKLESPTIKRIRMLTLKSIATKKAISTLLKFRFPFALTMNIT